eukprot:7487130-Pyramimonas_sp.AAC.1
MKLPRPLATNSRAPSICALRILKRRSHACACFGPWLVLSRGTMCAPHLALSPPLRLLLLASSSLMTRSVSSILHPFTRSAMQLTMSGISGALCRLA